MIENLVTTSIKKLPHDFHWHEALEINYVLQGSMDIAIGTRIIHVEKEELAVVNYGDSHKYDNCSDDLIYVQLHLNIDDFERYIPGISTVIYKCEPGINDQMAQDLKKEIEAHIANASYLIHFDTGKENRESLIVYSCIEILNDLKLGFKYGRNELAVTEEDYVWDRIWEIVEYMYDNYSSKITLKTVADYVSLNEAYVSRFLKKHTRKSFEKLLSFIRSEVSIRYLLSTDLSITAIAYECGFSAPRYYNAAFKKHYNCSPQEWRKMNRPAGLKIHEDNFFKQHIEDGIDIEKAKEYLVQHSALLNNEVAEPLYYVVNVNDDDLIISNTSKQRRNVIITIEGLEPGQVCKLSVKQLKTEIDNVNNPDKC